MQLPNKQNLYFEIFKTRLTQQLFIYIQDK